ncbi:MAG: hypothetical protein HRU41_20000 [Saprospiraceae bacterium]|nr:hypothetical protein [Saprospiraceae bacterium]
MLSIFATTDFHEQIQAIIHKEERLHELVNVLDLLENRPIPSAHSVLIKNGEIAFPLDWLNFQPPFLLPEEIALTEANLLGILFAKLNNYEKAYAYLQEANPSLFQELDFINRLQQGIPVNPSELISHYTPFEEYRLMHNNAILRHYAATSDNFDVEKTVYFYEEALKCSPNEEYHAFSARQLALLLIDLQHADKATEVLEKINPERLSKEAKVEWQHTLCQSWMQQLTVPYDLELLEKLKSTLWGVLQSYEQSERKAETGLLLLDAAHIANISESYSESLGYSTRAIKIFTEEGLEELAGNAQYRKGTLLYTWAQNGNPQFFKPAIESYQEALKVFRKEVAPDVFADIHHNLAVLYSDMPSEQKKKSIWAGIAVASFDEALRFFTKDRYPYQYGMICNNYGNAFTKFPAAVLTDNHEKALFYYQEALDVRTEAYPYERAITLLNFLEASWDVGNDPESFNEERYQDMLVKVAEVKTLVDHEEMIAEANKHLALLEKLRATVAL